jgi:heme/copper-type cytochrome/quinol oxidase subunit 1
VPFDDLPLLAKVLIAVVGPPTMTIICWLVGPLLAGTRRERTRRRSWIEFWLMLLAAYLFLGIAFVGSRLFAGNDHVDPSLQLIR